MRKRLLWPAVVLALLAGCSSLQKGPDIEPPLVRGADPNAPRAEIQTPLSDGLGIAALINKNYNEDTISCTDYNTGKERGYYWCTGVLLRTTDNGAFNPWESSPTALRLGGTSYSWIRHDLNTRTFYKRAGFILLNPADILASAVPGLSFITNAVTCVYPFDAYTVRAPRAGPGCNFEGTTGLNYAPWGSCDQVLGYGYAQQWIAHFQASGQVNYRQCSWSADTGQFWRNMIWTHTQIAGQSSWNEVMVDNWGQDYQEAEAAEYMRRWTVAFFWDVAKAGSLADAQAFQRKMTATGKRVPILRLNFSAAPAQRFSYVPADQVAGQYP